jgi:hypothetical protein
MTRSNINETAVYIQVRTVVWEDGAVRPLLPDFEWAFGPRNPMKTPVKLRDFPQVRSGFSTLSLLRVWFQGAL